MLDVLTHRGLNPHNSDVHCGIDGGQGSLKVGITVTERNSSKSGRAHYSDVRFCDSINNLFESKNYRVLQQKPQRTHL